MEHSILVEEGTRPIHQLTGGRVTGEKTDRAGRRSLEFPGCSGEEEGSEVTLLRGLPTVECLNTLSGSKFFSMLDLVSGYWQVPLDEDAQEKSAFATRSRL